MAAIPVRNFATLVGNFAVGVQGRAKALVDFSVGSVMRAVAEATSDVMLWFQSVVVYLLTLTRAGTSKGDDLDTWYADWFFFRLPAKATTGVVTFARFSADNGVIVPVGVEVATGDGSRIFSVYADASNPAWDRARGCYVVPAGVFAVDVPVAAVMPANTIGATAWNVAAGQVNTARSTVEGLDTVTNAAPFTNGVDRESDDAFGARFPDYIAGLSRATPAAIRAAVGGVQQGLQCTILNDPGHVTVTVDDGTGSPSDDLVARVLAAVTAVGAGGVWLSVLAPIRVTARVEMTVVVDPAYDRTAVGARVTNALGAYIDRLGLGAGLPFTALSHVAYGIPGVTDVTNIMLNGKTASIPADRRTTIKSGAFIVAPSA